MDELFVQAIVDQREELAKYIPDSQWVKRDAEHLVNLHTPLAQVITGVRRSGKSTVAHRVLKNQKYAYINFDDERLAALSADKLNDLLEAVYRVYGTFDYLFLDEIQNIEHWHLFVNRLLRSGLSIFITGSNSKLLSGELASHLTGRYTDIELFPFSFSEYLIYSRIDIKNKTTKNRGLMTKAFDTYLIQGGFPEIAKGENPQSYLVNLFNSIVTRDIFYRYVVQHTKVFRDIALYLAANFGHEISYNRIKNLFEIGSENTVKNYVSYLEEAYLILTLQKFSFKKQENLRFRKVYLVDTGFASVLAPHFSPNNGFLLENIVYLALMRQRKRYNFELYYYKQHYEVDFVVVKLGTVVELIQVSNDLNNPKTLNREIRALQESGKELHCDKLTVITQVTPPNEKIPTSIRIINIIDWLLEDYQL